MQTKKTNMLKLKLQFFAEEPGTMHKHLKDKKTRHTEKVYSEEEFNQRLNSELQRRLKQKKMKSRSSQRSSKAS